MKKKNKTLIVIEIIIILMLVLLISYMIVTARNKKIKNEKEYNDTRTKEEILIDNIRANFKKDVERVKEGKDVSYIPCTDAGVNCTKIKKFNIKDVRYMKDYKKGQIFYIRYEWSCYDDDICFYNEQYDSDFNENGMIEAYSYYLVNKDGKVTSALGNVIDNYDEEESAVAQESMELQS